MSFFNNTQKLRLARSLLTKACPVYVQFYITARCNMACQQCNIIYASADCKEMNIEQINAVARNFAEIGVCIVLLIGGEPFVHKDLPDIVRAFTKHNIHVRMQTNGLADEDMLARCVEAGGYDISVSLDTLSPSVQDEINGNIPNTWKRAVKTVSLINNIFPENGTAFFGAVLMPRNMEHIVDVLEFATEIGWGLSLVPVHVTSPENPLGYRTLVDAERCQFPTTSYGRLWGILSELKILRRQGMNLYDCDAYIDDMYNFIVGKPIRWRRRNQNICDSPSLYFALSPDGNIAPCCDYRLDKPFPAYDKNFPKLYRSQIIHKEVYKYTKSCSGCMYGSYPEITLSARYFNPMLDRLVFFNARAGKVLKKMSYEEMIDLAARIFERNELKRMNMNNPV